jgi:hypothetical protein
MPAVSQAPPGVWAITAYFNPLGSHRRLANYRPFRERLGLPLVAVELRGANGFELALDDANILIRLDQGDTLWQKERLLNIALRSLPDECHTVAWADCDVIFENSDWAACGASLLDRYALVHAFHDAVMLPRDWQPGDPIPAAAGRSMVACIADGMSPADGFGSRVRGSRKPGLAWLARRDLLQRHGFYDACIVGGGDAAFCAAAYGCFEAGVERLRMSATRQRHFMSWALPFHDEVRGRVAAVEGRILHLWHGELAKRQYLERHAILAAFDPFSDVFAEPHQAWRWSSAKPELHARIREYFSSRDEDGARHGTVPSPA